METARVLRLDNVNVAASGFVDLKGLNAYKQLVLDVELDTLTGGTSPSVAFSVQPVSEIDGALLGALISLGTALVATGHQILYVGVALPVNILPPKTLRLSWVTTGSPSAATANVEVYGRVD